MKKKNEKLVLRQVKFYFFCFEPEFMEDENGCVEIMLIWFDWEFPPVLPVTFLKWNKKNMRFCKISYFDGEWSLDQKIKFNFSIQKDSHFFVVNESWCVAQIESFFTYLPIKWMTNSMIDLISFRIGSHTNTICQSIC